MFVYDCLLSIRMEMVLGMASKLTLMTKRMIMENRLMNQKPAVKTWTVKQVMIEKYMLQLLNGPEEKQPARANTPPKQAARRVRERYQIK
jgi:hypothetical protein